MAAEIRERRKRRSRIALPEGVKSACSRFLVPVCAMVAAGLGLAAFLGWLLGLPFLTSFGQGKIPMAPSGAVLSVLYGLTIFLRFRLPHPSVYWIGLSVHAAGMLISLLLAIVSYQGFHPEAEHPGFSILPALALTQGGHSSPIAALCFLFASLSFLASLPASLVSFWRAIAALLPACLLLAMNSLLVLAYLFGMPLFYGGAFIPPALPASMALVALGAALFALALPHARQSLRQIEPAIRFPYYLIVIFIILTMGILSAGYLFYRGYEMRCRIEAEHQLIAVADLKVAELAKWRNERMRDTEIICYNPLFSMLVSRYFNNQEDSEARQQLRAWLDQYQKNPEYDQIRLLDLQGVTRMSSPEGRPPASKAVADGVAEAMQTGQILFVDFYRHDYDQRIYLSVLSPILDAPAGNRVIGVLSLRVDPEKYLYPFILRWPLPSQTAETLLVRREGGDVLYLNGLRLIEDAPLKFRVPLERADAPDVMAVLGRTGIVKGVDYRDQPVISDIRPVPDSPWFLVASMNTEEVYAAARKHLWMIIGLMMGLLFGAAAGLAFAWRQQSLGFYEQRLAATAALSTSEKKYRRLVEGLQEGIWQIDRDGNTIFVNQSMARMLGYSIEEMLGKHLFSFMDEHGRTLASQYMEHRRQGISEQHEFEFLHKDGGRIYTTLATSPVLDEQGDYAGSLAGIMNITERRQAEEQIRISLAEKEVMLKEIHHRVKNNMQVIYSLLKLQAENIEDCTVKAIFEESRNRVNSMALVHEKLYQSKDLAHIDFKEYLQGLVQVIADTYNRLDIHLAVEMEPIALDVNAGIPCGLIVNELISNSFKHAFPDGKKGLIRVGINRNSEGDYVLTVADNGIGFPAERDFRYTSSLGLRLVKVLTGQLRGSIALSRAEGTRFSLTFPGSARYEGEENEQEKNIAGRG